MGKKAKSQSNRASGQREQSRMKADSIWNDDDPDHTWPWDINICLLSTTLVLGIYIMTVHPSVPGGDSGELIISAYELGVAHPPGYPLFTIMAKVAMVILPLGSLAWRVNFLNTCLCAAASGLLQLTVLRMTHCIGSSLLAVGLFTFSRSAWYWSTSAEVFGLNNLLTAAMMLLVVVVDSSNSRTYLCKCAQLGALLSGLTLCNQHTSVFNVVCLAVWIVWKLGRNGALNVGVVIRCILLFMLGLTPYLYIPLASYMNRARWTWGDQRTLTGFLTHLFRAEYGTFSLVKDNLGSGMQKTLSDYLEHAHAELCELGPFLALVGSVVSFVWWLQRGSCAGLVFLSMLVSYTLFFAWRANVDINNPLLQGVLERFWLQSDMFMAALAGVGYCTAFRLITEKWSGSSKYSMVSIFALMGGGIIMTIQIQRNFSACDQNNNYVVHDFAKILLDKMPPNALVFTKGDLPTNSMRYLHLCENVRPDLQLIDVEILSYEWSLPMLQKFYPRVNFPGDFWQLQNEQWPDGRTSFNFKALLDANIDRVPILACIGVQEKDDSWRSTYHSLPYGVCFKIEKISSHIEPHIWANMTGALADQWHYTYDGYKPTSWEKVANDEMWNAKISTAFFFYQQAERNPDPQAKAQLLLQSYELYFRGIKIHQKAGKLIHIESFPPFWHKNFALVCERLLHVDHHLQKSVLCKLAITHFKQYIHMEPGDKDLDAIRQAIQVLEQRQKSILQINQVDKELEKAERVVQSLEQIEAERRNGKATSGSGR